ncbi:hypothetical protein WICPIJ_005626 [Wickerhamomyces pijperi]|uniref:Uncharacterized protein n=1 Tax=Wickerhamomyces pijperi TaxID=599730 RepID=A0A9P8Q3P2_WICPI|nr:hypothetical protein WICPIJ_005626 [Wickerhamomyces pijperi]
MDSIKASTTSKIAVEAGESGYKSRKLSPSSQALPILGSSGTAPKNGIPNSSHKALPPPVVGLKIIDSFLHPGQTNPDMFSTRPRILIFALRQKSISFLTSNSATSWGVVTTNAPSIPDSFK